MEVNFKFNIGQTVHSKQDVRNFNTEDKEWKVLPSFFIVERIMQEFSGGILLSYRVRMFTERGSALTEFLEIELTDSPNTPE